MGSEVTIQEEGWYVDHVEVFLDSTLTPLVWREDVMMSTFPEPWRQAVGLAVDGEDIRTETMMAPSDLLVRGVKSFAFVVHEASGEDGMIHVRADEFWYITVMTRETLSSAEGRPRTKWFEIQGRAQ